MMPLLCASDYETLIVTNNVKERGAVPALSARHPSG